MLREFRFDLTMDTVTGRASAYLLELQDGMQWEWLADTEFGPFDTAYDVCRWLTQHLVAEKVLHLR